jgi:diguanylate cyclase (GGDEF)-like protein
LPQRLRAGTALQDVLDALPEEVALLDDAGTISMTNAAWRRFADEGDDSPAPLAPGANYLDACEGAIWNEGLAELGPALRQLLSGQRDSFLFEYPYHSPTQERHFSLHAERLPGGGALLVHKDITYLRSSGVESASATSVDALTRVLNRYGLAVRLTNETAMARTRGQPLSAVVVNCDKLRAINSHHGMILGDLALVEVARRVRDSVRPDDAIARIGSDEFVVLLRGQDVQVAMQVAERIRLAVGQRPISESHGPVKLTVSVAVAPVEAHTESLDSLLRELDAAMRKSKSVGRNRVTITGEMVALEAPERERLARVTEAMAHLRVAAQDLVQLHSGERVGVELLVRGPRGVLESPTDLFRTAVECDLLGTLDEACLRACLSQAHRFGDADVHINVYPRTLLALWPEHLLQWLAKGARPERICFELCEQQVVGRPAYLVERLKTLRALGFRIAVDDVGFGNSCLESLIVLEPDIVKIDRCFVTGVAAQPELARNLERLLRVAKALGAMSVVEGVEQAADAELAMALGADCGQGYLWSRPRLLGPTG